MSAFAAVPEWTVLAQSADAYTLTPGRAWSLVGVAVALVGVVVGVLALVRKSGAPKQAFTALGAGGVGIAIGLWVVGSAQGGPGTGYGIVGGFFDLVLGVVALGLGGLVLSRARRASATR